MKGDRVNWKGREHQLMKSCFHLFLYPFSGKESGALVDKTSSECYSSEKLIRDTGVSCSSFSRWNWLHFGTKKGPDKMADVNKWVKRQKKLSSSPKFVTKLTRVSIKCVPWWVNVITWVLVFFSSVILRANNLKGSYIVTKTVCLILTTICWWKRYKPGS